MIRKRSIAALMAVVATVGVTGVTPPARASHPCTIEMSINCNGLYPYVNAVVSTAFGATSTVLVVATDLAYADLWVQVEGGGAVASTDGTISCGTTSCGKRYLAGSQVTLNAIPAEGAELLAWDIYAGGKWTSLAASTAGDSITLLMADDLTVKARFSTPILPSPEPSPTSSPSPGNGNGKGGGPKK